MVVSCRYNTTEAETPKRGRGRPRRTKPAEDTPQPEIEKIKGDILEPVKITEEVTETPKKRSRRVKVAETPVPEKVEPTEEKSIYPPVSDGAEVPQKRTRRPRRPKATEAVASEATGASQSEAIKITDTITEIKTPVEQESIPTIEVATDAAQELPIAPNILDAPETSEISSTIKEASTDETSSNPVQTLRQQLLEIWMSRADPSRVFALFDDAEKSGITANIGT